MVTKIIENMSKLFRLASVLVIICLFVVKAAAYEEDFYIVTHNGSGGDFVLDVAANDVNHPTTALRTLDPTTENLNFVKPVPFGYFTYIVSSGFFGFDTFRYDYGPFTQITRVYILVIPSDNATDAGEGWCRASVGQPVNVTNGNMWLKQQDYLLRGFGEPIEITRFYNSITQANGLFGSGWTSQYDEELTIAGNEMLRHRSADGRAAYFGRRFTTEPFTSFSSTVTGSIVAEPDLSYTLTYKDGRKRTLVRRGN